MSGNEPDSALSLEVEALCTLLHDGQDEQAADRVDEVLARAQEHAARGGSADGGGEEAKEEEDIQAVIALLYVIKFAALINLERYEQCPAVADALYDVLGRCDAPHLLGEFHALSGALAYHQGALDRSVTHLVRGSRALERITQDTRQAADAWQDLATTYSQIGFHEEAVVTMARARKVAELAGADPSRYAHPEVAVRHALWLDHQGDTDGCIHELSEVSGSFRPGELDPWDLPYLAYAGARLAALGAPVGHDPAELFASMTPSTPEDHDLGVLGEACLAIAAGRPGEALSRLDSPILSGAVARSEVLRVRALALAATGDLPAALAAERAAVAAIVNGPGRLNTLYIEGIAARLDQEELRRALRRYTDEAHTDPLTGLPNRRHLERYVRDLRSHGTSGTVGVADLNDFKAINTIHGHLSGDEVLQQVAALLSRALRTGDFLARYGGDEFVVILPETAMDDAAAVSGRLISEVDRFDWSALVPATRVSLAIGLAELGPRTDFSTAFQAADLVMLREKDREQQDTMMHGDAEY